MRTFARFLIIVLAAISLSGCGRAKKEIAELRDRNAATEARLDHLEKQLDIYMKEAGQEPAVAAAPAPAAPATRIEIDTETLLRELEELVDARTEAIIAARVNDMVDDAVTDKVGTPEDIEAVFEDVVQDELAAAEERREAARTKQREERRKAWEERRKQRDQQRLDSLAEALSLSESQKDRVAEVETRSREQIRAMMTEMRESGNFSMSAFRESTETIRAANNEAASEHLSDEQMETYKTRQEDELSFFNYMGHGGRGWRGR